MMESNTLSRAKTKEIPLNELLEVFSYSKDEPGILRWKKRTANCIHIGDIATGTISKLGYVRIAFHRKNYSIHRLIYQISNGIEILSGNVEVDHIDTNKLNNHHDNLRVSSRSNNMMNIKYSKVNKSSKYKGVTYCKNKKSPWRSRIRINNKLIHLGYFLTEIEAAIAYDIKAVELFGEFANINFK